MPNDTGRSSGDLYVAVAIGGAIGACARYSFELLLPGSPGQWPWATFVVNLSGALILGILLAIADARFPNPKASNLARRYKPFLITGVLGGYTTFSTFMVDAHGLIKVGEPVRAVLYIVSSVLLGVIAYLIGLFIGAKVVRAKGSTESIEDVEADALDAVVDEEEA